MRRILVDNARRKQRQKPGGQRLRREWDQIDVAASDSSDELLALEEALSKLTATDATAAQLVDLRFFAGMTMPQAAGKVVRRFSVMRSCYRTRFGRPNSAPTT